MSRLLLIFVVVLFVLLFVLFESWQMPTLLWFIIFGLFVGLYYGRFNHDIFHQSAKFSNEFDKVQTLWIHIVCGLASAFCLYILFNKFTSSTLEFSLTDIALLIFVILGICGLLPRAFWFLANKGNLKL